MTQTTTFNVLDIIYGNGTREVKVLTNQQWAGLKRMRTFKKNMLKSDKIATFTIKIKTK